MKGANILVLRTLYLGAFWAVAPPVGTLVVQGGRGSTREVTAPLLEFPASFCSARKGERAARVSREPAQSIV